MGQLIRVIRVPLKPWCRWHGLVGAFVGLVAGLLTLGFRLMGVGEPPSSQLESVVFGYGAPITYAVVWGLLGVLAGALSAGAFNRFSEMFGGLDFECDVTGGNDDKA